MDELRQLISAAIAEAIHFNEPEDPVEAATDAVMAILAEEAEPQIT